MIIEKEKIYAYNIGICSASVCAPNTKTIEEITKHLNDTHPTGISSQWELSEDKHYHNGMEHPCPCEDFPEDKKHYLFIC